VTGLRIEILEESFAVAWFSQPEVDAVVRGRLAGGGLGFGA